MRQRWLVVVAVASLALNLTVVGSFLFFQLREPRPPSVPLPGIGRRELEQLDRMRREYSPRRDSLRDRLFRTRSALLQLAAETSPSMPEVESLLDEIGRIEAELARLSFEHARRIGLELPAAARGEFFRRLQERPDRRGRPRWYRRPPPCLPSEEINP
ncbi:MAG: hypothetical protein ABIK43_06430 [candidate division WOR-3 bacterium]